VNPIASASYVAIGAHAWAHIDHTCYTIHKGTFVGHSSLYKVTLGETKKGIRCCKNEAYARRVKTLSTLSSTVMRGAASGANRQCLGGLVRSGQGKTVRTEILDTLPRDAIILANQGARGLATWQQEGHGDARVEYGTQPRGRALGLDFGIQSGHKIRRNGDQHLRRLCMVRLNPLRPEVTHSGADAEYAPAALVPELRYSPIRSYH
jgi:hypothetical protein